MDLHDIVRRLGGRVYAGGTRAVVPGPGHSRADRSLSLYQNEQGRVVWYTYANDPAESVRAHLGIDATDESSLARAERVKLKRERQRVEQIERARKLAFCKSIWDTAQGAQGSPVATYLAQGRHIPTKRLSTALRYHPTAPRDYEHKRHSPAMLALVCDFSGFPTGLHITYLAEGFLKHAGRIMVGRVAGGAVRLSDYGDELAIAEGVESALAYSHLKGVPCWAVLSTSGLSSFQPPIDVEKLIIAADRDDRGAGMKFAHALAERVENSEIDAAPNGLDWNDVLRLAE